jgi:hypothetical protein
MPEAKTVIHRIAPVRVTSTAVVIRGPMGLAPVASNADRSELVYMISTHYEDHNGRRFEVEVPCRELPRAET